MSRFDDCTASTELTSHKPVGYCFGILPERQDSDDQSSTDDLSMISSYS